MLNLLAGISTGALVAIIVIAVVVATTVIYITARGTVA